MWGRGVVATPPNYQYAGTYPGALKKEEKGKGNEERERKTEKKGKNITRGKRKGNEERKNEKRKRKGKI